MPCARARAIERGDLKDTALNRVSGWQSRAGPDRDRWGMAVSAYSKQPDAAWYFVQWATSRGRAEDDGGAGHRAAAFLGRERSRISQMDRRGAGAAAMAGRARCVGREGLVGSRLPHPSPIRKSREFIGQACRI